MAGDSGEFLNSDVGESLISEIKNFIEHHPPPVLAEDAMLSADEFRQLGYTPRIVFPVVAGCDIAKAETALGFPFPQLLKRMYLEISNGIAGFSYAIMGLDGGCVSDSGAILDTYFSFKSEFESEDIRWKTAALLPFCDWGCAIYSCVDCTDSAFPIVTYENSGLWAEEYTLSGFFEMWLNGKVHFSQEGVEYVKREITNPLTGKKTVISARTRRKPSL